MSAVTDLADTFFDLILERFPIGASFMGIPGHDDRLTDFGTAAEQRFLAAVTAVAEQARAVPDEGLSPSDRITKRTIVHEAETLITQLEGRYLEFTVSSLMLTPVAGLLTSLIDVPMSDDFPKRLAAVPSVLATIAQRQRAGLADGLTPVAHLVQQAIEFLDGHLTTVDALIRSAACRAVVTEQVAPAIEAYRDFLAAEMLPHGRDTEHAAPMAPHHVVSEVDRYLAAPGQALAYMVGRLEIQRLRRFAEAELGDRFDIRDFHEAVLGEGPVPLSVLAELIEEWVAARAG